MHGDMGGYYEIRVTGPGREQFRLFWVVLAALQARDCRLSHL
jgi:hypothetical protein